MGKDLVTRDLVGRDLVVRDLVGRDLVNRDLVTRDLVARDLVAKDSVGRDLVTRDLVTRDLVVRDLVGRDLVTRGLVARDLVGRDRSNTSVKTNLRRCYEVRYVCSKTQSRGGPRNVTLGLRPGNGVSGERNPPREGSSTTRGFVRGTTEREDEETQVALDRQDTPD